MVSVDFDKNMHQYWIRAVKESGNGRADDIIDQIKRRFEKEVITEKQLITWGQKSPYALIQELLHFGQDW